MKEICIGRNILITGATSGIGAAIARAILEQGCLGDRLYLAYGHDDAKAEEFKESFKEEGKDRITLIKADLSSYEEMKKMAGKLRSMAGSLDWLVLNTGISVRTGFEDYTFEQWQYVMNTNLSIPAFLVKELLPCMKEGGSILFVGSYAGSQAYSSSIVYGVSKAGVHFLAKSLVKAAEPKKIRVNAIAPGFIETPWHTDRSPESRQRIEAKIALHRFGEAEEVGKMALSILENGYMNGTVVEIHGGYDYY